ncbi:ATP synthase subunit a [Oscillospiraceae bacterium]|nr:ATP synthase subunit a [Oscillospiraceae bacterium]BDF73694.1 ATP synthase subunit a [Oscillospiraceae bacterium]
MDALKQTLTDELQNQHTVNLFGVLRVPQSVVVTWIIMAVLVLLAVALTRHMSLEKPGRVQTVLELLVGFLNKFTRDNTGEHWRSFAPYLGTVALYLVLANLAGLFGLDPPTRDLNVTAALALMSMVLIYGAQFRFRGLKGGLKKFAEPSPVLLPINIMEIAIRPLSLCMRLFGNILGSFVIMELIKFLVPVILPVPFSLYFDVFDGMIQMIVFVFLTALFVGDAVRDEE